jgi:hypothetical protein
MSSTFDLHAYSEGWQGHRAEWETAGCKPGDRRMIPTPGEYFFAIMERGGELDQLCERLGLQPAELFDQLESGQVREEHWPAILKAEVLALQRIREKSRLHDRTTTSRMRTVTDED